LHVITARICMIQGSRLRKCGVYEKLGVITIGRPERYDQANLALNHVP